MTERDRDDVLRRLLQAAHEEEAHRAPPFRALFRRRARRSRAPALLAAAAAAAVAAAVFIWITWYLPPPAEPRPVASLADAGSPRSEAAVMAAWTDLGDLSGPTDFLLRTPDSALLRQMPRFAIPSVPRAVGPATRPTEGAMP